MIKKLTPVLYVEEIEPQLALWEERLGFERLASVPHGERLGFVILSRDGVEVMLQTHESVAADVAALHDPTARMSAGLYMETDDLDRCAELLAGIPPVVPRRFTFYGAEELGVRAPSYHPVVFARIPRPPAEAAEKAAPRSKPASRTKRLAPKAKAPKPAKPARGGAKKPSKKKPARSSGRGR